MITVAPLHATCINQGHGDRRVSPDDDLIDLTFGEYLRQLRSDRRIIQIAHATGIDMQRLSLLEQGATRGVTESECRRLALYYRVPFQAMVARAKGEVH